MGIQPFTRLADGIRSTIIRLVPVSAARSAAMRACQWAGGALFAASLGYFLFAYTFTFGEIATGPRHPRDIAWNAALFAAFALHHSVFARTPIRRYIA